MTEVPIKLERYIAIDIETTGLDKKDNLILEIGAIFDNGIEKNIEKLSHRFECRLSIPANSNIVGQMGALMLHKDLFKDILNRRKTHDNPVKEFEQWMAPMISGGWVPVFAGKNAANFDIPFLIEKGFSLNYSHKIIDVGSMYFDNFGYVPSLSEINKLTGRKQVSHRAFDDALDIVYAIRHKLGLIPC